jgi:hypothetical protein
MIAALLLHGSGVLSSIHKLTHDCGGCVEIQVTHCADDDFNACAAPSTPCGTASESPDRPSDDEDQPKPDQDDEGCEICLGLAGLHLIPIENAPRIVTHVGFADESVDSSLIAYTRVPLGDQPARAPPAC